MSVKLLKTVMLLSTTLLILFVVNGVHCKDTELFEELAGREVPLTERIASYAGSLARNNWESLITANLNGYYNTLVYAITPQDFDKLPGFNTTKLTTVALLGHFAIILSGIYFLSLLPAGSLNGLIPRIDLNRFDHGPFGRRRRRRYRHRPQPFYHDYDYREYEDDYEYNFGYAPPRDHRKRTLRHGPPIFNRRMVEARSNPADEKAKSRQKFDSLKSLDDIQPSFHKLVKRQAAVAPPWWARVMDFATGPFTRFQRSYSQLFDHYGDFWRFRLSNDETSQNKQSTGPRIPPPPNVLDSIRNFNSGFTSLLNRLTTGVKRVAERRSSPNPRPPRQRHQGNRPRRRFRQGKAYNDVEEHYGPPPAAPSVEVVQALHE